MTRNSAILSALGAVVLLVVAWMFLLSPQNERVDEIRADIQAQNDQATSLESQITGLEQVRERAPEIEADIAETEAVVPTDPALPAALRQLQAAADDAGVQLTSVTPGRPVSAEDATQPTLYVIPLAVTTEGSYFQTVDFLRRLEDPSITARGIEVSTVTLIRGAYPSLEATISASMYASLDEPPQPVEEAPAAETTTETTAEGDAAADEADGEEDES